jgi:pimeloyl-ACP methyl ester carboxylesterase
MEIALQSDLSKADSILNNFFPSSVRKIGLLVNLIALFNQKLAAYIVLKMLSLSIKKRISPSDHAFYNHGVIRKHKLDKRIFYSYSYGIGPKVLMLHGFCSNGARWKAYVDSIVKRGFEVIVIDAPGHGRCKGHSLNLPEYIKLVDYVLTSEKNVHSIVAHSIGCIAATFGMANCPSNYRPKRLILMSSFSSMDNIMCRFTKLFGVNPNINEVIRSLSVDYLGKEMKYYEVGHHLKDFNKPVMLIADRDDPVVPIEESRIIASHMEKISLQYTEHLGHNLRSKDVVTSVVNFISE